MSFSNPSSPIFIVDVPEVRRITSNFVYNFYVQDEAVNEASGIPEAFKTTDPESITSKITDSTNFTRKIPRFVRVDWEPISLANGNYDFVDKNENIVTEDDFTSSKFINYIFSDINDLENAYRDITKDGNLDLGTSQATNVDRYVDSMLKNFAVSPEDADYEQKKKDLLASVKALESLADNPSRTLGISFYDSNGNRINDTSGFEQTITSNDVYLRTQLNTLVLPDLFSYVSLSKNTLKDLNNFYKSSLNKRELNVSDITIRPVKVGQEITDPTKFATKYEIIGYVIERYEEFNDGLDYKRGKVFYIKNPQTNSIVDTFVKYGTTYHYVIRTVALIKTQAYDDSDGKIKQVDYLVSSKPKISKINCSEFVAPPPPINVGFVWDYKSSVLNISWDHPPNPQRDITQYQVFRRKSIHEPFELLHQKCFDFSAKKFVTGENIDGNSAKMTSEEKSYVSYEKYPVLTAPDEDFTVDAEILSTSKFIYAVASVDAHGLISNYSAQFEVGFNFFKNRLDINLISRSGAPRQYPNLNLETDLFKDTISVSGQASAKMKVYFMPEYFKLYYGKESKIEKVLSTKQENAYYKLQFINVQNQKTDSLKITIDDPLNLSSEKVLSVI